MFFETAILTAYAITIVSESVFILLWQRPALKMKWFVGIVLINSFTHPLVMFLLHIQSAPYLAVEVGTFVVESLWYRFAFELSWKRAFLIGFLANLVSIGVGWVLRLLVF